MSPPPDRPDHIGATVAIALSVGFVLLAMFAPSVFEVVQAVLHGGDHVGR